MINEIQDRMPATTVRSILNEVIGEVNAQSAVLGEPVLDAISNANTPSSGNPFATLGDLPEVPSTWSIRDTTMPVDASPSLSGYIPLYDSNEEFRGTVRPDSTATANTLMSRKANGRAEAATPSNSNSFELVNIQYLSQYGRGQVKHLSSDYEIIPADYDLGANVPTTLVVDCEDSHDVTLTIPATLPPGAQSGMSIRIALINDDSRVYVPVVETVNPDHVVHGGAYGQATTSNFYRLEYVGLLGTPPKHHWVFG